MILTICPKCLCFAVNVESGAFLLSYNQLNGGWSKLGTVFDGQPVSIMGMFLEPASNNHKPPVCFTFRTYKKPAPSTCNQETVRCGKK